jgi:inositol oxygenase
MTASGYRDYTNADDSVRRFYALNHRHQTFEFARAKRKQYGRLAKRKMGVWEACELLDTLIDDSDPDTELSQIEHCLQTAEGIRRDGRPDWFVLAGLVHDLGKILCAFDEPQWAVTGDTFVLGCAFSDEIVHPEYFADNPDTHDARFAAQLGIYASGCGLDQVTLSWGHDEYMYLVARDYLPEPALYMIRYHSFYPGQKNSGIVFELNDSKANRAGIGSRIIIHYGPGGSKHQLREIKASGGFLSYDAPRAHLGLGEHRVISRVEVIWSTGENTELSGEFRAGHRYVIERT